MLSPLYPPRPATVLMIPVDTVTLRITLYAVDVSPKYTLLALSKLTP